MSKGLTLEGAASHQ